MLGHGGDNSSEWRLRAQVVLLRHLAAERIKVDILLRLGAIQRGLIVLDKRAGNICAGTHVALVLGRQLNIFGQAAALGDRLGHGHGGHGGQSRSGGQILAGGRGRGKCVEVELMTRRAAHARADGHRRLGRAVPMKTSSRSLHLQHLRVPAALFKLPYLITPVFFHLPSLPFHILRHAGFPPSRPSGSVRCWPQAGLLDRLALRFHQRQPPHQQGHQGPVPGFHGQAGNVRCCPFILDQRDANPPAVSTPSRPSSTVCRTRPDSRGRNTLIQ